MSYNYNEEFFDRSLRNELTAEERSAFESALKESAALRSSYESFREYRNLLQGANTFTASENFTDDVIRTIRKRADARTFSWKKLFEGLFSKEVAGVLVTILVLAVVFQSQLFTLLEQPPTEESLAERRMQKETVTLTEEIEHETDASEKKEMETAPVGPESETVQKKQKKRLTVAKKSVKAPSLAKGTAGSKAVPEKRFEAVVTDTVAVMTESFAVANLDMAQQSLPMDETKLKKVEPQAPSSDKKKMVTLSKRRKERKQRGKASLAPQVEKSDEMVFGYAEEVESIDKAPQELMKEVEGSKTEVVFEDAEVQGYADSPVLALEADSEPDYYFDRAGSVKITDQPKLELSRQVSQEKIARRDSLQDLNDWVFTFSIDPYEGRYEIDSITISLYAVIPETQLEDFVRDWNLAGGVVEDTTEVNDSLKLKIRY